MQIQPLKLIKAWKGVEVIQAITPRGIRVVKRTAISRDGEVDSGLIREIEIHKRIRTLPPDQTTSLIRPIATYVIDSSGPEKLD
jgi:hypothetical protein